MRFITAGCTILNAVIRSQRSLRHFRRIVASFGIPGRQLCSTHRQGPCSDSEDGHRITPHHFSVGPISFLGKKTTCDFSFD